MSDADVKILYEYYRKETNRLCDISNRTKKKRIKSKLFNRIMELKDKYDWTYDELHRRDLLGLKDQV